MCQDISSNLVAHAAPAEKIGLQVQLLGRANAAVERNPAHDLGVHEVTWVAAYLPDATVRFLPVRAHMLDQRAHHLPHGTIQRLTVPLKASLAPEAMHVIEHFSENIQLFLLLCSVSDAYRARTAIAVEVRQLPLLQVALSSNTVHNLEVFAACVIEASQPVRERVGLLRISKHAQRIQGESGIAQPGVAIIPVTYSPELFRQRSSRRGYNCPRWCIGQHFQDQRAALHPFGIGAMIGALCRPHTPADQRMSQRGLEFSLARDALRKRLRCLNCRSHPHSEQQAVALLKVCLRYRSRVHGFSFRLDGQSK